MKPKLDENIPQSQQNLNIFAIDRENILCNDLEIKL